MPDRDYEQMSMEDVRKFAAEGDTEAAGEYARRLIESLPPDAIILDSANPEGWDGVKSIGWAKPVHHVISSTDLLALLRRVAAGEDPDLVYLEEYANANHEEVE